MKIKYEFANETVEVEVSEEWGSIVVDLDRQEYNANHRETRRHCSLEAFDLDGNLLPSKDDGESKCGTPTLDTDTIKQLFLKAYNQLMKNRQQLIESCEVMRKAVNNCEKLDAEIENLSEEIKVVAELVNQCIKKNAASEQSQEEYTRKYNRLVKRYENAMARLKEVSAERENKNQRDRDLRTFIAALKENPLIIEEFDEELWICLLESATVHAEGRVTFCFRDGTKITK